MSGLSTSKQSSLKGCTLSFPHLPSPWKTAAELGELPKTSWNPTAHWKEVRPKANSMLPTFVMKTKKKIKKLAFKELEQCIEAQIPSWVGTCFPCLSGIRAHCPRGSEWLQLFPSTWLELVWPIWSWARIYGSHCSRHLLPFLPRTSWIKMYRSSSCSHPSA